MPEIKFRKRASTVRWKNSVPGGKCVRVSGDIKELYFLRKNVINQLKARQNFDISINISLLCWSAFLQLRGPASPTEAYPADSGPTKYGDMRRAVA